jgi:hypothetical protein
MMGGTQSLSVRSRSAPRSRGSRGAFGQASPAFGRAGGRRERNRGDHDDRTAGTPAWQRTVNWQVFADYYFNTSLCVLLVWRLVATFYQPKGESVLGPLASGRSRAVPLPLPPTRIFRAPLRELRSVLTSLLVQCPPLNALSPPLSSPLPVRGEASGRKRPPSPLAPAAAGKARPGGMCTGASHDLQDPIGRGTSHRQLLERRYRDAPSGGPQGGIGFAALRR